MLKPRYRKIIRDLVSYKSRTLLVVLAIAVGVFAFGSVFITQEVLLKNIDIEYKTKNPSTVTLYLSDFDESLVKWVNEQKGVSESSPKATQSIKFIFKGKEVPLNISAVKSYSDQKLNLLNPLKGSWPPDKWELALERNSFTANKLTLGDMVTLKNLEGKEFNLPITATVYDNSAFPYVFTNQMTGFVSWETMGALGFPQKYNQLDIATSDEISTQDDAEKLTYRLSEDLKKKGIRVNGSMVLAPKEHWATDNSKAFTTILSIIGIFSLVLSGFLVINTISALLTQQKKQIGIMKAIGGSRKQITLIYVLMVAFYGVLALIVALPVGMLLAYIFLRLVTNFLNMDINVFYLPFKVLLMEVAAALLVPVIASIVPIISGTKKSVREVISDFAPTSKASRIDRLLTKISGFNRLLLIPLRNTFRKKGRLVLTLGTLAIAGALFMSVINVRTSLFREMDRILAMFDFQVAISLAGDYPVGAVVGRLEEIDNIKQVEARTQVGSRRIKTDGSKSSAMGITGLPPDTPFSHPVLITGRWLTKNDSNKIVLSSSFVRDNPDLKPGDEILLDIDGDEVRLGIVGIIVMSGDQKGAFSDFNTVARLKDKPNLASQFLIKTNPKSTVSQLETAKLIEDKLKNSGITVSGKDTRDAIYASASNQFNFMIFFLLAMAVMVAIVGGLGLAGTMSLNVLERTREIGIMRSLGAKDSAVRKIVLTEGILVGIISFVIAIPLSFLLTLGFCSALGNAFFERPLVVSILPVGMVIWFLIVMIIAIIASVAPSSSASKMTISETLSYE